MLPTQNGPIKKLNNMLRGLACINQSTKLEDVKSLKRQLAEDYQLRKETLSQIVETLENDYHQEQITALQNTANQSPAWVGYYIKTTTQEGGDMSVKENHINITVMLNRKGDLQVVVKPDGERKEGVTKNEGSFKRATNETMIRFDENGKLRVDKVVSIKHRPQDDEEKLLKNMKISQEVIESDHNAFSCYFPEYGKERKRDGDLRTYQQNKGMSVSDFTFNENNENNPVDVNYAMQYMLQIGEQLSGLHDQGISHFDAKLENMLIRQVDGHPVFTLIDCPPKGETEHPSKAMKESPTMTLGVSCPPHTREVEKKDPKDPEKTVVIRTDSWSNGLYRSQDGKGDPQPEKDGIDKIWLQEGDENPIATKYWKSEKRFTGHVDDSYAYLRGLYLISCAARNEQLFDFAIEKMQELANQTLAYVENEGKEPWPEGNLTVAKIQEEFAVYCNEKPSLKAAFNKAEVTAKQAGSGPDVGLRITIPKEKKPYDRRGRGTRRRYSTYRANTQRTPSTAIGVDANQIQPAVTVAMVLKEQRDTNWLRKLWLWLLDCMTGKFGEGSRRTLYKDMYSEFRLEGVDQKEQVDFGWELIAQSLENKRFETGCVEFAQALIVAEVLSTPEEDPETLRDQIIKRECKKLGGDGNTPERVSTFTSKLDNEGSKNMILSAVQTIKNPQQAAPSQAMQGSKRAKTILQEANVVHLLREANKIQKKAD